MEVSDDLNIDGPNLNYIATDDKIVALARKKDNIYSDNKLVFYFEVEIINQGSGIIAIGFSTKPNTVAKVANCLDIMLMPGQYDGSWGYHCDDGYAFCSDFSKGRPYGPLYTTGDTIGCYINFRSNEIFYTKNGVNLGIAFHLSVTPKIIYPCIGVKSKGGSIRVNFGDRKFQHHVMNMKNFEQAIVDLNKVSVDNPDDYVIVLTNRAKAYFVKGEYEKAYEDLTKLLKIEPNNTFALKLRVEINQLTERFYESSADLRKLLKINPDNKWAKEALNLVDKIIWESILESFRLDRPDLTLDLFDTIVRKSEKNEDLTWEKTSETTLKFYKLLVDLGMEPGLFLSSK